MKKKICLCIVAVVLTAVAVVAWLERGNVSEKCQGTTETIDSVETEQYVETQSEPDATDAPEEIPRMVMVDGELYKDADITSHVLRCGVMDGEITSTVKEGEQPTQNDQSNFGKGYGYQPGNVEGRVEVFMEEGWHVFSKEEVDWGITLSTKDETSTGLVLLCTQAGGNPTGVLQTGSYYILETLQDGVWTEAAIYAEVAWTMEALVISSDSTAEWEIDWEWLYGELGPGLYRIGKEFMDFRGTGNYDSKMFYAEFAIVD